MNNFTAVFNQGFSDRPILTSDISFFLSMKLIENNSRIRNREDKGKTDVTWAFLIDRRRQQYETPRFSSLVLDSLHFSAEETLDLDDNDDDDNPIYIIQYFEIVALLLHLFTILAHLPNMSSYLIDITYNL